MSNCEQVEQELARAAQGIQEGNEGLARVCARRAVAAGLQDLAVRRGTPEWTGDAMRQLNRIRKEDTFPLAVRHAAQRLLTTVTQQHEGSLSTDPIADARLILTHLEHLG